MKKENFVTLLLGTTGGILFALGMCMCLITEWNLLSQGIILGGTGIVVLLIMLLIRRKMQGKPLVAISKKILGRGLLGTVGALTLGVGMCMTMVWKGLFVWGIVVGLLGILLLISLIPICRGLH